MHVAVYDGEAAYAWAVVDLHLGYVGAPSAQSADHGSFTSITGHRYLLKVTESGCVSVGYTLQVAPGDDLASVLTETRDCRRARGKAKAAHVRSAALRAAGKKARGKRRAELRRRLALQAQAVVVADAAAKTTCTRRPLTGYPFE